MNLLIRIGWTLLVIAACWLGGWLNVLVAWQAKATWPRVLGGVLVTAFMSTLLHGTEWRGTVFYHGPLGPFGVLILYIPQCAAVGFATFYLRQRHLRRKEAALIEVPV